MSQTINRMFATAEQANAAAAALRSDRFNRFDEVHVTSAAASGATTDEIVAALMKACVIKWEARILAVGIKSGGSLVTVHAPFGSAVAATQELERHGPIESGLPPYVDDLVPWDEAAPLSSALSMPVLVSDNASFSSFWGLPMLTRGQGTTSAALGWPEISRTSGPFTGTFGMALLSRNPTPLSSMIGLPLLTAGRGSRG
jgi:hypothetical protein